MDIVRENPLVEQVRTLAIEAISIYDHITGQQQVVNISIDRSIELYMVKNDVPMTPSNHERLKKAHGRMVILAKKLGINEGKCETCPKVHG